MNNWPDHKTIDIIDNAWPDHSTVGVEQENTAGQSIARQLGLAARAAGPAAAGALMGGAMGGSLGPLGALGGAAIGGVALPLSDAAVGAYNWASGSKRELPSQALDRGMTQYLGLPEPANATERGTQAAIRAMLGSGAGALTSRGIAAIAAPNTVGQGVANTLAANPMAQVGSSASGAFASNAAQEMGAGPVGSLAAGLLAGAAPYAIRPENVSSMARWMTGQQGDPGRANNIRILTDAGIPTTPAQRIGSPGASVVESVLKYLPTSAGRSAAVADDQARAFTRYTTRPTGFPSDVAPPEYLGNVKRNLSNEFEVLLRQIAPVHDAATEARLISSYNQARGRTGLDDTYTRALDNLYGQVFNFMQSAQGPGRPQLPAQSYQRVMSQLSKAEKRAAPSDNPNAEPFMVAVREAKQAMEDLMFRSASTPDLRDRWQDLTRRYAAYSTLKDAQSRAGGGGVDKMNKGFVPPSHYAAEVERRYPEAWATSTNLDYINVPRAAAAILPDPVPNSGTAQRSFVQNMIMTPAGAIFRAAKGNEGPVGAGSAYGGAAAAALIDPFWSIVGPNLAARAWHGQRLPADQFGILAAQSVLGSEQRTPEGYPYIQK